jgi:hypothetical protein
MNEKKFSSKSKSWNKKIKSWNKDIMCAQCECKRTLLQKRDKSWQKYVPKIGVEQTKSNEKFCFYLKPLGS